MKRRVFLRNVTLGTAGSYLLANSLQAGIGAREPKGLLRGFIVSDSHFGWRGADQPKIEVQRDMMKNIMRQFPDLDVFIDTGDAHHNYANEKDRGDWTDIIANGCDNVPFYYVAGNHEISAWNKPWDPELNSNTLGSVSCRPYYSFDIKGIHFVSIPQMHMMSYISDEAVDWLKLDLEINKNKNTIMLSHNSLEGTTKYFDDKGYRMTANSDVMFDLFKRFPQVMGWMHGHNHTYEVVPRKGTVYVSNGRIGGFNPSWDKTNDLGGIYFEVGARHFAVRAWSATKQKFFDQMKGFSHLGHVMNLKTSFNSQATHAHSYGVGMCVDGRRIPVVSHHAGESGKRDLFIAGSDSSLINENPDFAVFCQRTLPDWKAKHLPGYGLQPGEEDEYREDHSWKWLNPGLRIVKRDKMKDHKQLNAPGMSAGQRGYYRCAPGKKYKVKVTLNAKELGPKIMFSCVVHDCDRNKLWNESGRFVELQGGKDEVFEHTFEVPKLDNKKTIYNDDSSDVVVNMVMSARFEHINCDIDIRRFEVTFADADGETLSPAVAENGKWIGFNGTLKPGVIRRNDLDEQSEDRNIYQMKAEGNRRLTWLVRETGMDWQVRNAPVLVENGVIKIGPLRNKWTLKKEIVISPLKKHAGAYVRRMRNVDLVEIHHISKRKIKINVKKIFGDAEIELRLHSKGTIEVLGAKSKYVSGVLTLYFSKAGEIIVKL